MNGEETDPLWVYLKKKQGGLLGNFIKWNFTKFLVNQEGVPIARYSPKTNCIVSFFIYRNNFFSLILLEKVTCGGGTKLRIFLLGFLINKVITKAYF